MNNIFSSWHPQHSLAHILCVLAVGDRGEDDQHHRRPGAYCVVGHQHQDQVSDACLLVGWFIGWFLNIPGPDLGGGGVPGVPDHIPPRPPPTLFFSLSF